MAGLWGHAAAQGQDGLNTQLFDTTATWNSTVRAWDVPLHAWVYAPQTSSVRKAAIAALFKRRYGLDVTPEHQALFDERINLLLTDNKRGQRPIVRIADRDLTLEQTGPNGHIRQVISMSDPDGPGQLGRGWHLMSA
jgi:hypothetical protein